MHRGSRWDEDGLYSKIGAEQTDDRQSRADKRLNSV